MADEDLAIEDLAIEAAPVAIFDLAIVDRSAPRSAPGSAPVAIFDLAIVDRSRSSAPGSRIGDPGLLRKFRRSCAPKNPLTDCGTTIMFRE